MITNRSRLAMLSILAAVLIVPILACKNADTITGVPAQRANISGTWAGTFLPTDLETCGGYMPVRASFTQEGSFVVGTLDFEQNAGDCGGHVEFRGTFEGNGLTGTLTGGGSRYRFRTGSTARGTLSGTTLELTLFNTALTPPSPSPGGHMQLHFRP